MRFYTLTIISSVFALLSAAANAAPTPEEDILLNVEFVLDVSLLLTVGADDDNFAIPNANEDATSITQNGGPATCTFYGADGVVAVTTDGQTVPIVPPQPLESGKCTS